MKKNYSDKKLQEMIKKGREEKDVATIHIHAKNMDLVLKKKYAYKGSLTEEEIAMTYVDSVIEIVAEIEKSEEEIKKNHALLRKIYDRNLIDLVRKKNAQKRKAEVISLVTPKGEEREEEFTLEIPSPEELSFEDRDFYEVALRQLGRKDKDVLLAKAHGFENEEIVEKFSPRYADSRSVSIDLYRIRNKYRKILEKLGM